MFDYSTYALEISQLLKKVNGELRDRKFNQAEETALELVVSARQLWLYVLAQNEKKEKQ